MGTKRHMANHVRVAIEGLDPSGRVVDLFSGMGSVAESLQDLYPIITNDALSFTAAISRTRFTRTSRAVPAEVILDRLRPVFASRQLELEMEFGAQLEEERAALREGKEALVRYMSLARHVGNDGSVAATARRAATDTTHGRYCLATLYFSAGYFSLRQSIAIDAIRCAIDTASGPDETDWLLSAWLVGLSALVNAPGHTAQFLKPNKQAGYERIVRTWKRSMWEQFASAIASLQPVGSQSWRAQNEAFICDAIELVGSDSLTNIGAFYADPPYTKDQYSRFYHVYETLYRYDFPASRGAGRTRLDGFSTGFSLKSSVVASFHDLCRNVARRGVPLVVSYPDSGLLCNTGWSLHDIASTHFARVQVISIDALHSTMGASKGHSLKIATENLYVCRP